MPDRRGRSSLLAPLVAAVMAAASLVLGPGQPAQAAASLPSGFHLSTAARGLVAPVDAEVAADGRVFIAEQAGRVRVLRTDGSLVTFVNLRGEVDHTDERGLLGVALDPEFATNHFVYVDYTVRPSGKRAHQRISRFTARGNKAVPGSEKVLLQLGPQTSSHHIGGSLDVGPDGKLYISTGDNQASGRAQRLNSFDGKVLRINRGGGIPSSNPFYTRASGRYRSIWARGLRNPYKIDFRPGTATLFANDVGENTWEEIDQIEAGHNYGWPREEGPESATAFTPPLFAYRHGSSSSRGCAITGGTFYDPAAAQFPAAYRGDYFFADFCSGWIRRYDVATDTAHRFATGFPTRQLVDLATSPTGDLYALRLSGVLTRISYPTG